MSGPNPIDYGWWLASRASGIVAMLLVSASVILGLTMAAGLLRRPGLKGRLAKVHEQLAVTGLAAIAVHGVTLLGDSWLRPGLQGILVPFSMSYRPGFTGLGIIAAYLAALLGLSFYARRRIGARRWRKLHRATSVVWVLGVVHALGAGTDGSSAWFRYLVLATAVPVLPLLALRVARSRRPPRAAARPRPRPATAEAGR